jgi:polyhydroxybutyrate depolymerase
VGIPLAARPRALIVAAALAACACACSRGKAPVRVRTIDGESPVLPRITRAEGSGATKSSHQVAKGRGYVLVEPSVIEAKSYPLVLVFHGDGGNADGFHGAWPFERATGKNAFLAYLDGIGRTWDLETTRGNRDIAYAEAVIAAIEAAHPIDHGRIFATGYSSGGFLANVLACHRPGLLRAIASNAGGAPYNQLEKWPNGYPKCPGQKPTAMLALHGENDFGVTLDSGRFSAEYWAYVNGCNTSEMETTGYAECRVYSGCPAGKAVGFCSIPPLGHWVWDAAAEASWTFFERQ